MIGIYKITNLINGKSYVGQSVDIETRFKRHKQTAFNPNSKSYNYPLYRAIRKYGIENFSFDVVQECFESELNENEIFYIEQYNSYYKGYNQDKGGNNASHYIKLSDDLVSDIISRLKTTLDNSDEIGEYFGVTGRTIRGINSGECCRRAHETYPIRPPLYTLTQPNDNNKQPYKIKDTVFYCKSCGKEVVTKDSYCIECGQKSQRRADRPNQIELAKLIKENGFCQTGRMYNVSDNTIKKWCKAYNIPHLRDELISWYNNKMGIIDVSIIKEEKIKIIQEKKVKQIDPNTNQVINIFPSENDAARFLGKKKGNHIGEACRGVHKIVYGFAWEYA